GDDPGRASPRSPSTGIVVALVLVLVFAVTVAVETGRLVLLSKAGQAAVGPDLEHALVVGIAAPAGAGDADGRSTTARAELSLLREGAQRHPPVGAVCGVVVREMRRLDAVGRHAVLDPIVERPQRLEAVDFLRLLEQHERPAHHGLVDATRMAIWSCPSWKASRRRANALARSSGFASTR